MVTNIIETLPFLQVGMHTKIKGCHSFISRNYAKVIKATARKLASRAVATSKMERFVLTASSR